MFHPTPSYNHRQSCSIQYLGGKRKTPSSLGPLSWFNLLYGRLKSTQVSPTQRLSGGCYLIPFPCRASGSYSSPRSPCATVFDHLYIISPVYKKNGKALISSLFFHAFHDDEWSIETLWISWYQNDPKCTKVNATGLGLRTLSTIISAKLEVIANWMVQMPHKHKFRPATSQFTQGETYEQPPNTCHKNCHKPRCFHERQTAFKAKYSSLKLPCKATPFFMREWFWYSSNNLIPSLYYKPRISMYVYIYIYPSSSRKCGDHLQKPFPRGTAIPQSSPTSARWLPRQHPGRHQLWGEGRKGVF